MSNQTSETNEQQELNDDGMSNSSPSDETTNITNDNDDQQQQQHYEEELEKEDEEDEQEQQSQNQQQQNQPANKKRKIDDNSDKHSEEDLEEGELRDDDDDDDDDEDDDNENDDNDKNNDIYKHANNNNKRSNLNNNNSNIINNNNNNLNNDNYHRDGPQYGDPGPGPGPGGHRHPGQPSHRPYYPHPNAHGPHPAYHPVHHNMPPNQGPPPYMMHMQHRRQMSPNSQPPPEMMYHGHYPPNHYGHYENSNHYNNSRYQPDGPPMPMNYPPGPMGGGMPINAYGRGAGGGAGPPGPVGPPIQKQNTRCRFYSKYGNKCTWGETCRFMHIDDSPEPVAGEPYPDQPNLAPSSTPPPPGNAVRQPSPGNSSSVHYDRKHRLAFEMAPWNEARGGAPGGAGAGPYSTHGPVPRGYGERIPAAALGDRPPMAAGDPAAPPMARGPPSGYHNRHGYYGRPISDQPAAYAGGHPYNHLPPYHPSSGYPNAYRPSMAPHHSHSSSPAKYSSHPSRTSMPPEARRSRSNKMGHDEDESSWSDSGSEDSILGQSSRYHHHSHRHPSKPSVAGGKRPPLDAPSTGGAGAGASVGSDEPEDLGGSGTPPGEPLIEDRQVRDEILLTKLKEINELIDKKKSEQDDAAAK